MKQFLASHLHYKPVNLVWLKKIPNNWRLLRGKQIFNPVDIRSETGAEELLSVSSKFGIVPRKDANVTMFKAQSYVGYKMCWPNDLVINSIWAWAQGLGVSRHHGIISSAYGVYRIKEESVADPRFIHYLVRSTPFQWELQVRSKGIWTSRLQLSDWSFLDTPFPLPPIDEQRAIVKYLDYVDKRVRMYIRAKQKQIKLLQEMKQAIIHLAVTRSLDPTVPLKPSSVDWFGDIPEDWHTNRLVDVANIVVSNVNKLVENNERTVRLCNYTDVYKNDRIFATMDFMDATATDNEIQRFHLEEDDVAITKDSEMWNDIGVPALVVTSDADLVCGYHLAILRPKKRKIIGEFLFYTLQSQKSTYQFSISANGITRYGLSFNSIKNLFVSYPNLDEQKIVCNYVRSQTNIIEINIENSKNQIQIFKEYQTRFIADVVTGKLDIREAASQLPEEIEELLQQPMEDLEDEPESMEEMEEAIPEEE